MFRSRQSPHAARRHSRKASSSPIAACRVPAILQISSYWREGQPISLDLAPGLDALKFLKERKHARPKAELKTILAELLPQRLAQAMAPTDLPALAALLKNWTMTPDGSEGFAKAEVTAGGIDTE